MRRPDLSTWRLVLTHDKQAVRTEGTKLARSCTERRWAACRGAAQLTSLLWWEMPAAERAVQASSGWVRNRDVGTGNFEAWTLRVTKQVFSRRCTRMDAARRSRNQLPEGAARNVNVGCWLFSALPRRHEVTKPGDPRLSPVRSEAGRGVTRTSWLRAFVVKLKADRAALVRRQFPAAPEIVARRGDSSG